VESKGNNDSIVGLVTRLIDDVERFVRAEVSLYRAQMLARAREAQGAIMMLVLAFVLAQATVFTLLVALVLMLRRWMGIYWASGLVVGIALILTLLLAKTAAGRLRSATRVSEEDE
jgi:Putative Actinobacterial Holin-X, holin superfamily III